ncbi:MAG TPA: hypothetical protein VG097_02875 [Gemmata sp.]|nr:hypothetical protein [Gemmata sp.]
MDKQELQQRLSRISTQWTMVLQAHGDKVEATQSALQALLERYSGAAFRYLMGAVRNAEVAEELAQEFAFRFVRGDFRRADRQRGRFRDYLKTSLIHLVHDWQRHKQGQPLQLGIEPAAPAAADPNSTDDFLAGWRTELLERTWQSLADDNSGYHAALQYRVENPEATSNAMAEHLTSCLGKPVNAALARKMVERAHIKFADLLLEEVAISLEASGPEELEKELNELDLLKYCRSALERRRS